MRALLISQDFQTPGPDGLDGLYGPLARGLDGGLAVLAPGNSRRRLEGAGPIRVHRRRLPIRPPAARSNGRAPLRFAWRAWIGRAQLRRFYRHAVALVDRERADLVLIEPPHLAPIGPRLRRLTGVRYAVVLRGDALAGGPAPDPLPGRILRALDAADLLIVDSERARRRALQAGVRANQRFVRLAHGVDTAFFRPDAGDGERVRRGHRLERRALILSTAPPAAWAAHEVVIRALPAIRARVPSAAYLIAAGERRGGGGAGAESGPDAGPGRAGLEALVRELGLVGHVVFAAPGSPADRTFYYRAADLLAMPVRAAPDEAVTLFLEAAACGLPAVGGPPEWIEDGVTGFRVGPDEPEALVEAAARLLTDGELARRFGRAARDRAVQLFDRSRQAERLARELDRAIGESIVGS